VQSGKHRGLLSISRFEIGSIDGSQIGRTREGCRGEATNV